MSTRPGIDGHTVGHGPRMPVDRFRLGASCARGFGGVFVVSAMLNLVVPELGRWGSFTFVLLGLALMVGGFVGLGGRHRMLSVIMTYGVGLGTLAAFQLPGAGVTSPSSLATATSLASMAIPSLLVAVADRPRLPVIAVAAGVPVLVLAVVVTAPFGRSLFVGIAVVGGWVAMSFAGLWLARSAHRAEAGLDRLRQGYATERRSTEAEAELRYGARVLHDTVLATLTVIAHGGIGAAPEALRAQAAADSLLLQHLRGGGSIGQGGTAEHPGNALDAPDGFHDTIDSWCLARGLTVTWHGDDHAEAPPAQLDALLRAVCECLENVRRHSGELCAEITVSQSERTLRAVVTDSGIGFDREFVAQGHLGLGESIEARIAAAGGSSRVFSSAGRGTTVLLEVPR